MLDYHFDLLDHVHPIVRAKFYPFHTACQQKLGAHLLIVTGWRSNKEQWDIYKQGREYDDAAKEWKVIDISQVKTNAKPGLSGHNLIDMATGQGCSLCVDVIPFDKNGKPLWALPGELPFQLGQRWVDTFEMTEEGVWSRLYDLCGKFGLDALGDPWGAFLPGDKGHMEEPGYKYIIRELGLAFPPGLAPVP